LSTPYHPALDCLRKIRSEPSFKNIPIAVYSALNSKKLLEETFDSGADYFLVKPNSYSELHKLLKKFFNEEFRKFNGNKVRSNFIFQAQ